MTIRVLAVLLLSTVAADAQYYQYYGRPYYGGYGDVYSEYRRYRDYQPYYPTGRGWSNQYQNYYGRQTRSVPRYRYDWSWGGGDRGYLGGRGGGWGGEW